MSRCCHRRADVLPVRQDPPRETSTPESTATDCCCTSADCGCTKGEECRCECRAAA